MDKYDAQGDCVRALSAQGRRPKKGSDGVYRYNCLRHPDKNGDAWLGEKVHGCFACSYEESITTLCEALGVAVPKSGGLTVEQLCERKGFSLDVVTRYGLRTVQGKYGDVVEIPYRDKDGNTLRCKHRVAKGSFWGPGVGSYLYGLDMLAKAKPDEPVIFCEGETDAIACWSKAILAIGVSGGSGWKSEWAPLFAGRQVYIWQEPGAAGAKFAQDLSADFPEARIIRGEVSDA